MRDMLTKCWETKHLIWTLVFGLPGLILVLFVFPFSGIAFLVCKRKKAEDPKFMQYFILLYQGYKVNIIYWEFINIIRKIILVVILSVIPYNLIYYKGMLAFLSVLIFWRFQKWLQPYKKSQFNQLEEREMICSILTIYCILIFLSPDEL